MLPFQWIPWELLFVWKQEKKKKKFIMDLFFLMES
jgi:hypothetical protein